MLRQFVDWSCTCFVGTVTVIVVQVEVLTDISLASTFHVLSYSLTDRTITVVVVLMPRTDEQNDDEFGISPK